MKLKFAKSLIAAFVLLSAVSASAQTPNIGYYAGEAMFYPYDRVYCPTDTGTGSCYGVSNLNNLPESAPLPQTEAKCRWVDITRPMNSAQWYQWAPRTVSPDRSKYLGDRVCYFADRGRPKKLDELESEEQK